MKKEMKNNEKEISQRENKQLFSLFKYYSWSSLSPDPFFASLFSFLFERDTNLAHPIKNC